MNKILVINAGSSSIKFKVFLCDNLFVEISGVCEAIGLKNSCIKIEYRNQTIIIKKSINDFEYAINLILDLINERVDINKICSIGHRIVHGGNIKQNQLINENLITEVEKISQFAPLHNPIQIQVYKILKSKFKDAKHFAFFDTVFHCTIPRINHRYAITNEWYQTHKIKKYGFHGISYAYILDKMRFITNKRKLNLIVLHLGNGASMCAIKDSKSFDTTMGFSPLDGLVMGTRSGDISSSIIKYLVENSNYSLNEVYDTLNKKSGLLAICGMSDMREIINNLDNKDVKEGFNLFIDRIVRYLVSYINLLGDKIDGIVFCGGIGENVKVIHEEIVKNIAIKKLLLANDYCVNEVADYKKISADDSQIPIYLIKTNEEYYIANEIFKMLK